MLDETSQLKVLDAAIEAGHILLESGAEIFRVQEIITQICRSYGMESISFFILANGIFATAGNEREVSFAKVENIPISGIRLDRVMAVNQLAQDIEKGNYTIVEVAAKLAQIRIMRGKTKFMRIIASGVASGSFAFLFGGNIPDSICAFVTGLILYVYVIFLATPYLSKLLGNIGGGAVVTLSCSIFYLLVPGTHLDFMIIGSVMPLVPGLAFTNGIRDIVAGDYISGSVRMLDALMVFFCIALGVAFIFTAFYQFTRGTLL